MVKSRRPPLPASSVSPPTASSYSSSPSPASLSLISHAPHLKQSTASCTPFIASLKRRCPLLEVNTDGLSALTINSVEGGRRKGGDNELQVSDVGGERAEEGVVGRQEAAAGGGCGRARLQQHWIQVGGKVMIPDTWGLEQHLQEWVSFGLVEDALRPAGLLSARSALVADCQHQLSSRPATTGASSIVYSADPVQVSSCG